MVVTPAVFPSMLREQQNPTSTLVGLLQVLNDKCDILPAIPRRTSCISTMRHNKAEKWQRLLLLKQQLITKSRTTGVVQVLTNTGFFIFLLIIHPNLCQEGG